MNIFDIIILYIFDFEKNICFLKHLNLNQINLIISKY